MIRTATIAAAFAIALAGAVTPAMAVQCKDAKGKFIKCPPAAPAPTTRCKDGSGKFAKCGTPGAVPMK